MPLYHLQHTIEHLVVDNDIFIHQQIKQNILHHHITQPQHLQQMTIMTAIPQPHQQRQSNQHTSPH